MLCDEARQRLRRQEWNVAVDDKNIAPEALKLSLGRANGVSCAALLVLKSEKNIVSATDLLNGIGLITDHHHKTARVETLAGLNDMREEWFPGQAMQDFGLA